MTSAGHRPRRWRQDRRRTRFLPVMPDISDAATVETAMCGCDAVAHFAAKSHVGRSIYEPAPVIQTNVTGTFILLELTRKFSVSRFVHVSGMVVIASARAGSGSE